VEDPATRDEVVAFNDRYGRPDPDHVDMREFVDSVIAVLRPDRWISRSDFD